MKIGDKITFVPAAWLEKRDIDQDPKANRKHGVQYKVTGKIVEIYQEHRYFLVRYKIHGCVQYEAFKF